MSTAKAKKPSYSQLETLRDIANGGRQSGLAERFALPLIRNGWTQNAGESLCRTTFTTYIYLTLTDAGKALVASKAGCCSRCACTAFVLDPHHCPARARNHRCICKHHQFRHGG